RKAYLLEDKQIASVGAFDEVFSTWMGFGGYTRDLGSFGEETDEITDLHQISWKKSIQSLETVSQADQLLHHEVEGWVDELVEEVEGLESNQEDVVDELVKMLVKELQNLLPTILAQVGNHVNNQGNNGNQNNNVINDNIQGDVRNVNMNSKISPGHEWIRGQEAEVGMTWDDFKALMREEFCPNNEMQNLETEFWYHVMAGASHAVYTNQLHELARLVPHLVTLENKRIERVLIDEAIRTRTLKRILRKEEIVESQVGMEMLGMITRDIRLVGLLPQLQTLVVPRIVNLVNARNHAAAHRACFECGGTDHYKAVCPRLNRAPRQGGMDWLSRHKAKIVSHKKVIRIPLPNNEMLRVLGERPEEKVGHLMSAKAEGQKLKDIVIVRKFSKVFLNNLSGLPPSQEIEFPIDLVPRATPVAKSPYHLAPSEMEELSSQIRELHDKDDILIYSKTKEEQEMHLGLVLVLLKKDKLYAKLSKCEFWLREVQFLRHMINGDGIYIDPSKIEAVKKWEAPRTPYKTLKDKLCNPPVPALPDRSDDFMVYCDASCLGLGDYDYEICYHPGKANVVANVLSKKERINPKRVRAMNMTIQSRIKDKILAAQNEASKAVNATTEILSSGLLQQPEIPEWKWERIAMDFVTKLPRTSRGHDIIWVIMDRLTKSAHFLPIHEDYKMDRFWQLMQEALGNRLDMSTAYHPQTDGQSECTIQTLEDMLRACVLDLGGVGMFIFHWLSSHITIAEVREAQLIGLKIVQETTEKISHIKDRLKAVRDRLKSYADKRRKPLEFSVGDHVLLRVSPWKGVVRFRKKGKLAP
ncbi:putative reverse transcriptase domain-containing protein, partial [Tanacetum coccineum]